MNDEEFEKDISLLRESYLIKPKNTQIELEIALHKLGVLPRKVSNPLSFKEIVSDIDFNLFIDVVLIILIGIVGLFHLSSFPIYIFGVVFFVAGLFIGMNQKGFGLLFLVTHGGVGFYIMMSSLLENVFKSPKLTDPSYMIYFYFGIMIILGIVAIGMVFLRNLSDKMKSYHRTTHIILFLFLLICILAGLFPYIIGTM